MNPSVNIATVHTMVMKFGADRVLRNHGARLAFRSQGNVARKLASNFDGITDVLGP